MKQLFTVALLASLLVSGAWYTTCVANCTKPSNLKVDAKDTSTAVFTWKAGGSEPKWQYAYALKDSTVKWNSSDTVKEKKAALAGLQEKTKYTFYVRAVCSASSLSDSISVDFTTDSLCVTPKNLDTVKHTIYANSATIKWNAGKDETQWQYTVVKKDSVAKWEEGHITSAQTVTLTGLEENTDYTAYVRSRCNEDSYSNAVSMTFKTSAICHAPTNLEISKINTTSAVATWPKGSNTKWQYAVCRYGEVLDWNEKDTISNTNTSLTTVSHTINSLNANTHYFFYVRSYCSKTNQSEMVSSQFYTAACFDAPTNLTITLTSDTSATATWTKGYQETKWQYALVEKGKDLVWANDNTVSTNSVTLSTLKADTDYTLYVRAFCDSVNNSEAVSASFCTCMNVAIPWGVNFRKQPAGSLPECWRTAGDANSISVSNAAWISDSDSILLFTGAEGGYAYAILPPMDSQTLSKAQIAFRHIEENATYSNGIELGYYLDDSFHQLHKFDLSTSWKMEKPYPLMKVPSGAKIAFGYRPKLNSFAAAIDSIQIDIVQTCAKPTDLLAMSINDSVATLAWKSDAYMFNLRYKVKSETTWAVVSCNATEYTITNLKKDSVYEVQVQAVCGKSSTSAWTSSVTFTAGATCVIPTDLSFSNITPTSADIYWTATADTFNLYYKKASASKWDSIGRNTSDCRISNLEPDAQYDVKVQSVCGKNKSEWSGTLAFTTGNTSEIYLSEQFSATLPAGWDNSTYDDYGEQWSIASEGTNYFVQHLTNEDEWEYAVLKSPTVHLQMAECPFLLFDWRSTGPQTIRLMSSINGGVLNDLSEKLNAELSTSTQDTWQSKLIRLSDEYVGQSVRFVFRAMYSNSANAVVAVDNVIVQELIQNNMHLTAESTEKGVKIEWKPTFLNEKLWNLRYKEGTSNTWIDVKELNKSSYKLIDLVAGVKYEAQVQPVADDMAVAATWTTSIEFTPGDLPTAISSVTTPVTVTKRIINGHLFIIRDGNTYTIHGQRIE